MAIVLTDGEFVTLDESFDLQDGGGGAPPSEDDNDDDISLASLNAAFSSRLFGVGELELDDSFAADNGVASNDFISLTEDSTLTGFVKSNGDPLVAYDSTLPTDPTLGVLAGFTTVDGEAIYLFADVATGGGLGAFMFLGVDASGDIVLAGHLQADGTISTVQLEAIANPDSGDHDDPVDLEGLLDVAASGTLVFDLDDLPSGSNLFAALGPSPTGPAIMIFGADVELKTDGSSTPQGDVMFFSQAGPNATIGMNNQQFNPGDAAFFAYVNDVDPRFLSGWPDGLDSTEADDADNALYTGGTLDVTSAKFTMAQFQGNDLGTLELTTYLGVDDTARDLLEGPTDGATSPNITVVKVTIGATTHVFDSDSDPAVGDVDVSGLGTPTVTITGIDTGYAIEFITSSVHNRVMIEDIEGKFDIGGFVITQGVTTHVPVGDRIVFEDDGPSVGDGLVTPALTVDDSDFATDPSVSYAGLFDVDFGTDGGKDFLNDGTVDDDAVTYVLGVSADGADSGLVDTLTGEAVLLNLVGDVVIGTTALTEEEVFRISVDAAGVVTLDQSRAVVHNDPGDPEEDTSAATLASDLITLTATATDDDLDTADHAVNIGDTFNFEDDGPAMELSTADVPSLVTDDTDTPTSSDTDDFAVLFSPVFGNDEAGDPATTYALGVTGEPDAASGLFDTLSGEAVVLNLVAGEVIGTTATGGDEVLRISVDADGNVTVLQSRSVVHNNPGDPSESTEPSKFSAANLVTLTATAFDGDDDHDDAVANIGLAFNFEDDGPSIERNADPAPDLIVDETTLLGSVNANFSGLFTPEFGKDDAKDENDDDVPDLDAITYALSISGQGDDTGLVDTLTGEAVVLDTDDLDIIGTVGLGGPEVFRVSANPDTGVVTLTQSRAVMHDNPLDPDEEFSPAVLTADDLVHLTATIHDGDGDHTSATIDIGGSLKFEDDGPALGSIDGDIVAFAAGESATDLLGAVTGADDASVKITSFTPTLDLGFAKMVGDQLDDQTVVYYEDVNGDGVRDAGEDNAFFQLTLDDSGDPADWNYVFDVLQDPAPVSIEFNFDNLPSGANLFGVVGDPESPDPANGSAILVFGKTVSIKSNGNYDNASDVIKTSQGGTGATIGVDSQMFDPGDGAYFVYIDDPVANFLSGVPGGLSSTEADDADNVQYTGGTVDVHTASISISQTQGNSPATMKLTTFLGTAEQGRDMVLTPDGTSPNIDMVKVTLLNGNELIFDADSDPAVNGVDVSGLGTTSVVVSGLTRGSTIEWTTDELHNRVLVEGLAGKFDVGKFSIGEAGTVPDAQLDFEVTIEDFDIAGDTDVESFSIGVDGDGGGVVIV